MRAAGTPRTTEGLRVAHLRRLGREVGGTPATLSFDELVRWMAGQPWAPNTRRAYRQSFRAFYAWAMATGLVTTSPAHLLPPVTVPRSLPRPAPEHVFRLALRTFDRRARLAIMLAGTLGLRRGEIAQLQREDMERDLVGWSLRVVGKGGHVRVLPLPELVAKELLTWPPGYLFPSPQGGHLTPHHLGKIVSSHLPDGLTTHTLRHRFGTITYRRSKDLRAVQELMGHKKIETTQVYTAIESETLREVVELAL